jgi:hypothetical protein
MTDSTQQPSSELSLAQRQEILQREIEKWVSKGYSVESKTETRAILSKKKKIKLIKHIVIAALTLGIWLLVLLWQTLNRKSQTVTISVDEKGKIKKS